MKHRCLSELHVFLRSGVHAFAPSSITAACRQGACWPGARSSRQGPVSSQLLCRSSVGCLLQTIQRPLTGQAALLHPSRCLRGSQQLRLSGGSQKQPCLVLTWLSLEPDWQVQRQQGLLHRQRFSVSRRCWAHG